MRSLAAVLLLLFVTVSTLSGEDWPSWRGPNQNGISDESDLISSWSPEGQNLLWRVDFIGRATPVVFRGRVCANGRVGEGIRRQGLVACFDAVTGQKLWEHRFNIYRTTVPWNRVGWAHPVADPETGNLYVQGVGGLFFCFDESGKVVWSRSLGEQFGFYSGYGGRTQTPMIDGDRLIVTFANSSYGDLAALRHRLFAFAKRTGDLLWVSTPGKIPYDPNSQTTPIATSIGGRKLLIHGNGDGWIYAIEAATGKQVWGFELSKRAINTTVVVDEDTVYASHSEENVDAPTMGRIVAIDGTGTGNVTATHEKWRSPVSAGFASPILKDGRLYVVDNSANLHSLDAQSGETVWTLSLGTVGKGSPVWGGGKIFLTEVNGHMLIVEPGDDAGRILDKKQILMPEGRYAEIYGSPAISDGRIYFTTEEGLYCLGAQSAAATLFVTPAHVQLDGNSQQQFSARALDRQGRSLPNPEVSWSLEGLVGNISPEGLFKPDPAAGIQIGKVRAVLGDLSSEIQVRVFPRLELEEDFESVEIGGRPSYFLGAIRLFSVAEEGENRYLVKSLSPRGIHKQVTYIGPEYWRNYTVQADLFATRTRRRIPDLGLVNSGYTMDLMGVHQQIQVRSWASEFRMSQDTPFSWETDTWYTMKFRVETTPAKAILRGKVWKRSDPEPSEWTVVLEDPLPIDQGSPGLYGFSPTPIYFDNIKVMENQ